jgi:hypothetical protein
MPVNSKEKTNTIEVGSEAIHIKDLSIDDPEVVSYFQGVPEDQLASKFQTAVHLRDTVVLQLLWVPLRLNPAPAYPAKFQLFFVFVRRLGFTLSQ